MSLIIPIKEIVEIDNSITAFSITPLYDNLNAIKLALLPSSETLDKIYGTDRLGAIIDIKLCIAKMKKVIPIMLNKTIEILSFRLMSLLSFAKFVLNSSATSLDGPNESNMSDMDSPFSFLSSISSDSSSKTFF